MKSRLLVILVFCVVGGLFAQSIPLAKRHFDANELLRQSFEIRTSFLPNVKGLESGNSKSNTNMIPLGVNYQRTSETVRYSRKTSADLDRDFKQSLFENAEYQKKKTSKNISLSFRTENRVYVRPKFFWGIGALGKYSEVKSEIQSGNEVSVSQMSTMEATPHVSVGYGRAKDVTSVQHAYFLIDGLRNAGVLRSGLDFVHYTTMLEGIAALESSGNINLSRGRVVELERIINYLRDKNYVDTGTTGVYAAADKVWKYGADLERKAGSELYVEMGTVWSRMHQIKPRSSLDLGLTTVVDSKRDAYLPYMRFVYDYQRPITNRLQLNASASVVMSKSLGSSEQKTTSALLVKSEFGKLNLSPKVDLNLSYFPNARTRISFGTFVDYNRYRVDRVDPVRRLSCFQSFCVEYYLTPRLKANLWQVYNLRARDQFESQGLGIEFSLVYRLF
jgi:hypothetical protein